ncbi:IS3 family transposase [Pontibacter sp. G13]|uniref:IS3 family transposase n=1 Tax=Pontibacter sp. G13 TaxID=3074898 RepID=UPI00288C1502|nr:IS3 family transposase [Pontibacter sp. G13]WNJ21542.1 IS3 family transposase [Pontibacter sp. G13]
MYEFIGRHRGEFSVERMCKVMEVSRSGYYAWRNRPQSRRAIENRQILEKIRIIHAQSRRSFGSLRITRALRNCGIWVSRPRVARLMRAAGLRSKVNRRRFPGTRTAPDQLASPNVLDRNFEVGTFGRAWVSDISYIWTRAGWIFLTMVMDLADRQIIGWSLGHSMKAIDTVVPAWRMARTNREVRSGLIFHSDRGSQYSSAEFREELGRGKTVVQSMSRKGNCWDNAVAEAFFKSLKSEWIAGRDYRTKREAEMDIFEYIEIWYNRKRMHMSLDYLTPSQYFEKKFLSLQAI